MGEHGTACSTELYDPVGKTFTLSGSLTTPRSLFSASLLSNGQALFVGGVGSTQMVSTAELYDPTSGTTSIAGNLNIPRGYHAAAPLSNGLILIAGGIDGNGVTLDSAETYQSTVTAPPPVSVQITPGTANIAVGGTQQFTAVDDLGYPRLDITWTVSDPSIASVTTDEDNVAIVTGLAPGQITLTANAEGVTAQEEVTVLSQSSFVPGTTIWSAPPPAGFSVQQVAQAVPTADGPDLYSISTSTDGTQSTIQALRSDGEQLWQTATPAVLNGAVPDNGGGLITISCPSNSPMTVTDLDANKQPLWQMQSAAVSGYGYMCVPPQIAVGGDGTTYVAEPTNGGLPSLTVMYPNGYGASTQFPPSTVTNYGNTINVNCCVGPPMVNTDGTAYLEYEVRNTNNNVITSDTLYLYNATTKSSTVLSTTTQDQALLPGPIIPDGNGGLLTTWTISPSHSVLQYPYQAADVSNGVVGTPYNLPFSPQSVTPFQSPDLVLGEGGNAFASGTTTAIINGVQTSVDQIASFNVTSGTPNWTYQAPAGDKLSIIEATAGGGVTVNDSNTGVFSLNSSGISNSKSRASRLAGSANGSAASSLPSGAVPINLSSWVAAGNGMASLFWSPDGTNGITTVLPQSPSPQLHGARGQSQPLFCKRQGINCALAPHSDGLADDQYSHAMLVRRVTYWLFNLQNGTLSPLVGPSRTAPPVKIEEWEANSSNPDVDYCSWQKKGTECETPNTVSGGLDGPGQITDNMGAPADWQPFTMQQQFLVDRQGVQVFWPNSNGSWYGAWGTIAPSPPDFHPNQSTNTTFGWATITQINANYDAPTSCISGCDTRPPNSGPPSQ